MIYFDTAYPAKCCLNELGSELIRSFAADSNEVIASSVLARAELSAVFHRGADAVYLETARHRGMSEVFTKARHILGACASFGLEGRNLL